MEITIVPKDMKTKKTTLNTWFLAMGVRKMVGYMVSIIFVKFITNSVLLAANVWRSSTWSFCYCWNFAENIS